MHMFNAIKADVATVTGVTGFGVSLTTIDTIVSIMAGITATIASLFAIYWYIKKGRPEK